MAASPEKMTNVGGISGANAQIGEGNKQYNNTGGQGGSANNSLVNNIVFPQSPMSASPRNSVSLLEKLHGIQEKSQNEKDKVILRELNQLFMNNRGEKPGEKTRNFEVYNQVLERHNANLAYDDDTRLHILYVDCDVISSKREILQKIKGIVDSLSDSSAATAQSPTAVEKRRPSGIKDFTKKNERGNTLDALQELRDFFMSDRDIGEQSANYNNYKEHLKIAGEISGKKVELFYKPSIKKHLLFLDGNELDAKVAAKVIYEMIGYLGSEQKSTSEHAMLTQHKATRPSTENINALVTETIELMRDISKLDMSSRKSVLVMGQTGVGKSTLMNLLAGVRLRGVEDARGDIRIENPDSETGFKIGHKVASETTIPNRWQNIDGDHVSYWDCPGFLENRGAAQEIANALFIKKLFDTSQETKILIIIPHDDLKGKATNILSSINQLDYMFSGNISKIEGSISLIVSKSPPNKKASHVKEYLKKIIEEAPGLDDSKKSILEILSRNPISILKIPTEEGEIDPSGLMRADVLLSITHKLFNIWQLDHTICSQ